MLPYRNKVMPADTAVDESLWRCIRDSSADVVMNALYSKNLNEEMAVFIAKKKNISSEVLSILARDARFKASYKLKLAICKNPKTPLKVILSLLKHLRIFDLGDITKNHNIPISVRQKVEYSLLERAASLPSGVKVALAKRSSATIILALLEKGDRSVVRSCLEASLLTEDNLCKLINQSGAGPLLIKLISQDAKWSLRYRIRYCLVKNYYTPMEEVIKFISGLKTVDLRELYSDNSLPLSTRPYLFHELKLRNESVETAQGKRYNLCGDEDSDLADYDQLS
jgi:hypothetical protein